MLGRSAKRASAKAFDHGYLDVTKTFVPNAQDTRQWASLPINSFAIINEVLEKKKKTIKKKKAI
jgi:hypothetical protein